VAMGRANIGRSAAQGWRVTEYTMGMGRAVVVELQHVGTVGTWSRYKRALVRCESSCISAGGTWSGTRAQLRAFARLGPNAETGPRESLRSLSRNLGTWAACAASGKSTSSGLEV
jgi:hypothetical protein